MDSANLRHQAAKLALQACKVAALQGSGLGANQYIVDLLSEARKSLRNLRSLTDHGGSRPEVRQTTAYKQAEASEYSLSTAMEVIGKVGSNLHVTRQADENTEALQGRLVDMVVVVHLGNAEENSPILNRGGGIIGRPKDVQTINVAKLPKVLRHQLVEEFIQFLSHSKPKKTAVAPKNKAKRRGGGYHSSAKAEGGQG